MGYNGIRSSIKSVVIDESVKNYAGLTSTTFMFQGMTKAESISGAEYLNVSNVTDMSYMFHKYGTTVTNLNAVPNVSDWNTGNVKNMSNMFYEYGCNSTVLAVVPNVSKWNTSEVTNLSSMFYGYGKSSEELDAVPNVSKWNTSKVKNLSSMFYSYGSSATALNAVPDVSKWNTSEVTNLISMFREYGKSSTLLNAVPAVNGDNWNISKVTTMEYMFYYYGKSSTELTCVPDVSNWDTANVTDMDYMFQEYGSSSTKLVFELNLSNWSVAKVEQYQQVFSNAGTKAETWSVTIPAKTDSKQNEPEEWYVGNGTNTEKYIAPAEGKTFTSYTITFNLNGIEGTAPESQAIVSGGYATGPTKGLPTLAGHTLQWFTSADSRNGNDIWNFDDYTITEDITLYAQWTRDLQSICDGSSIPRTEDDSNKPNGAWVNGSNTDCSAFIAPAYSDGDYLCFKKPNDSKGGYIHMNTLFIKVGDKYEYVIGVGWSVTCNMEGEKLVSFDYADSYYEFLNGTYAPPTPK